jgi:nucleoside-diphosphate-sugar epimerase
MDSEALRGVKVLVTGATGNLGGPLARALAAPLAVVDCANN